MHLTDIFLKLVDMSVAASWVALAVLVLRLALKQAPKWLTCLMWVLVAVRLVCPVTLESAFSLMHLEGAQETVDSMLDGYSGPSHTYWDITEEYEAAVNAGIEPIHGGEGHYYVVTGETPTTEVGLFADHIAHLWVAGMGIMLAYALVSYWRIRGKVAASLYLNGNVFLCDYINTPFILGIVKPKIYLPSAMEEGTAAHVLAHERAHLTRKDHWWKPLGFCLLTLHWFNPVMWVAYVLLCRDIELACDEKVIRTMEAREKKAYSEALLSCSVPRHMIAACPLAFGEVGVKERVKTVLNYKKPAFWIVLVAVIALIVASVCLLTDPVADLNGQRKFDLPSPNVSDMDVQEVIKQIRKYNGLKESENPYVNDYVGDIILAENFDFEVVFIPYYYHQDQKTYLSTATFNDLTEECTLLGVDKWEEQENLFLLEHYLNALKYMPQDEISAMLSNPENYRIRFVEEGTPGSYDRVIRYSSEGVGLTDGWLIHLEVIPASYDNGGFPETGEESVHLFYGDASRLPESSDIIEGNDIIVDIAAAVRPFVEDYLENGSPYLTLSESDTALLEQLEWDKMVYTATFSGGGDDFVFIVNEPRVIDGKEVEYYYVMIGVSAGGELTNFALSGPQIMAENEEAEEVKRQVRTALQAFQAQESYHVGQIFSCDYEYSLNPYSELQYWRSGSDWFRYVHFGESAEEIWFTNFWVDIHGRQFLGFKEYNSDGSAKNDEAFREEALPKNECEEVWLRTFQWKDAAMAFTGSRETENGRAYSFYVTDEYTNDHDTVSGYNVSFELDESGNLISASWHVQWNDAQWKASTVYIYSCDKGEIDAKLEEWYAEVTVDNSTSNE